MNSRHPQVRKRDIAFARHIVTKIWQEVPSEDNPYIASTCKCHGYDLLELSEKCSFAEVLYLLLLGELPNPNQAKLLETLMVGLINPGPRHPATRAAMNAGVGKTDPTHFLPIGLSVLSGAHLGGKEVEESMRFLRHNQKNVPEKVVVDLLQDSSLHTEGDRHIAPGFGSRFGSIDPLPRKIASLCAPLAEKDKALNWGLDFAEALSKRNMGWLSTGVAAAVFCDLGFHPRAGGGLFQLINAPGLLAHGLEMANKSISAMPFLDEDHYIIEPEAKKRHG